MNRILTSFCIILSLAFSFCSDPTSPSQPVTNKKDTMVAIGSLCKFVIGERIKLWGKQYSGLAESMRPMEVRFEPERQIPGIKRFYKDRYRIAVPAGTQYSIPLAYGTEVDLNACSVMYMEASELPSHLELTEGQGYFKIRDLNSDSGWFKVMCHDIEIRVFNNSAVDIMAYSGEDYVTIGLAEGKCLVRWSNREILLDTIGTRLKYKDTASAVIADVLDANRIGKWRGGWIDMEDADVYAVVRQFRRWYSQPIIFSDSIERAPMRYIIGGGNKFKAAMDRLGMLADLGWYMRNDTTIILNHNDTLR